MIKSTVKFSVLSLTVLALATMPVSAVEGTNKGENKKAAAPPSKAERTGVSVPFRGTLTATTDTSISIRERVFEVTSETKITKDGKPATLADGEIGKPVTGQYRKLEDKLVARTIYFGEKPGASEKAKVKTEKPVTRPEVKSEAPAK